MVEKPICLNSLALSDKYGNVVIDEDYYSINFGSVYYAEKFINERKKHFEKLFGMKLDLIPHDNETLNIHDIRKIIQIVTNYLRINKDNLLSDSRKTDLVETRRIIGVICRNRGITFRLIGEELNINHATVMHHVYKKHPNLYETESLYKLRFDEIMKIIDKELIQCSEDGSGTKID